MAAIPRKQRRERIDSARVGLPTAAILCAAFLAGLAGCASVPPAPAGAANRSAPSGRPGEDPDENWLYKRVTGQQAQQSAPPAAAATPNSPAYTPTAAAPADPNPAPGYNPAAAPNGPTYPAASQTYPGVAAQPVSYAPGAAPPSAVVPAGGAPAPVEPVVVVATAGRKDEDSGFDWDSLSPDEMWKSFMKAIGRGPDKAIAKQMMDEGNALFRQKKFAEAVDKFYIASWRWPDSAMEEDAMFLMSESYFFDDQYGKAQDAYGELLKKHTNTRYLDTIVWRLFAIGRYWEQLDAADPRWATTPNFTDKKRPWFDTWGNAIAAYEAIHLHDPRGPLSDSAEMAIANMYFRAGYYEDAAPHYDIVRKDYPKSKHQLQAHLLGLQSKMRAYQGPAYDPAPLKDAGEIADQTLKQFRGRLGKEEATVLQDRARVVLMKAEREWAMAQFYDGKKQYGAAKQYYNALIQEYPGTPYAEQAKARLPQIQNEPNSPANSFKTLERWFDRER